jgi:hypothetical protein
MNDGFRSRVLDWVGVIVVLTIVMKEGNHLLENVVGRSPESGVLFFEGAFAVVMVVALGGGVLIDKFGRLWRMVRQGREEEGRARGEGKVGLVDLLKWMFGLAASYGMWYVVAILAQQLTKK